jgi:hypothetical protein
MLQYSEQVIGIDFFHRLRDFGTLGLWQLVIFQDRKSRDLRQSMSTLSSTSGKFPSYYGNFCLRRSRCRSWTLGLREAASTFFSDLRQFPFSSISIFIAFGTLGTGIDFDSFDSSRLPLLNVSQQCPMSIRDRQLRLCRLLGAVATGLWDFGKRHRLAVSDLRQFPFSSISSS